MSDATREREQQAQLWSSDNATHPKVGSPDATCTCGKHAAMPTAVCFANRGVTAAKVLRVKPWPAMAEKDSSPYESAVLVYAKEREYEPRSLADHSSTAIYHGPRPLLARGVVFMHGTGAGHGRPNRRAAERRKGAAQRWRAEADVGLAPTWPGLHGVSIKRGRVGAWAAHDRAPRTGPACTPPPRPAV